MIEPADSGLEAIDSLVREHLDREAARIDANPLLERMRGDLAEVEPVRSAEASPEEPRRSVGRRFAWSIATACAVVVAFLSGRYFSPSTANAASILRSVRTAHSLGVDRCYRVQFAPDPRFWDGKNKLEGPSESVLWTRGDRFWSDCTIADHRLKIGRDEDRTLWVSPSRGQGIRFPDASAPLPKEVAVICAINAMTVPALVDDVLADFDLRAEEPSADAAAPTRLVWAKRKPGRTHPLLSAAMLEIDARNDVLVRLVLWMERDGRPNGTVTYTLLDLATQSDDRYRLESHLDPDAKIERHTFPKPAPIEPILAP